MIGNGACRKIPTPAARWREIVCGDCNFVTEERPESGETAQAGRAGVKGLGRPVVVLYQQRGRLTGLVTCGSWRPSRTASSWRWPPSPRTPSTGCSRTGNSCSCKQWLFLQQEYYRVLSFHQNIFKKMKLLFWNWNDKNFLLTKQSLSRLVWSQRGVNQKDLLIQKLVKFLPSLLTAVGALPLL